MKSECTKHTTVQLGEGYTAQVQVTIRAPEHKLDERRAKEAEVEKLADTFVDTLQARMGVTP